MITLPSTKFANEQNLEKKTRAIVITVIEVGTDIVDAAKYTLVSCEIGKLKSRNGRTILRQVKNVTSYVQTQKVKITYLG